MFQAKIILQRGGEEVVEIDGRRVPHAELEVNEDGIRGMLFSIVLEHKVGGPKISMGQS